MNNKTNDKTLDAIGFEELDKILRDVRIHNVGETDKSYCEKP
jgi:hypothetical protein